MKRYLAILLAFALALTMALPILATEGEGEEPMIAEPVIEAPPEESGPNGPSLFAKIADVVGSAFFGILFSPLILLGVVIFFGAFTVPAILFSPVFLFNWISGLFK